MQPGNYTSSLGLLHEGMINMKITWPSLRISIAILVISLTLVCIQVGCVGADPQVQSKSVTDEDTPDEPQEGV